MAAILRVAPEGQGVMPPVHSVGLSAWFLVVRPFTHPGFVNTEISA